MHFRPLSNLTLPVLAISTAVLAPGRETGLISSQHLSSDGRSTLRHPGQPPKNVLPAALKHPDRYRETCREKTDEHSQ